MVVVVLIPEEELLALQQLVVEVVVVAEEAKGWEVFPLLPSEGVGVVEERNSW